MQQFICDIQFPLKNFNFFKCSPKKTRFNILIILSLFQTIEYLRNQMRSLRFGYSKSGYSASISIGILGEELF